MPMKKLFTIILLLGAIHSQAQYEITEEESKANLGFGLGLSYGGIGARLSFLPVSQLALFGAAGYNLNGLGYNVGAQVRLAPGKKVVPALLAMYGYNAVIVVQGAEQYNNTYYGPSVGFGVEINNRNGQNFFTIELLAPFRSQEFKDDLEDLQNNSSIEITAPWPVNFSFGYHIKF
jgi:hypothetical protein